MEDLFNKYIDFIKQTTDGAKSISEQALDIASAGLNNIEDKKQREFAEEMIKKARTGKLSVDEIMNGFKEHTDAS